jgi:hypothetical protein
MCYARPRWPQPSASIRLGSGIGYGKGKNPIINVIDTAAKWLHENNLGK